MIIKKYQVKHLDDYEELTEQDICNLEEQIQSWLAKCPVKTRITESINPDSSQTENYPHKIETIDILIPLRNPVEEEVKLKKYEVQYKIDVWGSIEVEAEDDIEAEEIALNEHQDDIYDNVYLQDFDIETDGVAEIVDKKVA